jgi:hypothetical protein
MADVNTTAGDLGWENAPDHYKGNGIECFDVWDAYRLDPYLANALKYLTRWDKKGSPVNDLKKASHYLRETIKRYQAGALGTTRRLFLAPTGFYPEDLADHFKVYGSARVAFVCLLESQFRSTPGVYLTAALEATELETYKVQQEALSIEETV